MTAAGNFTNRAAQGIKKPGSLLDAAEPTSKSVQDTHIQDRDILPFSISNISLCVQIQFDATLVSNPYLRPFKWLNANKPRSLPKKTQIRFCRIFSRRHSQDPFHFFKRHANLNLFETLPVDAMPRREEPNSPEHGQEDAGDVGQPEQAALGH